MMTIPQLYRAINKSHRAIRKEWAKIAGHISSLLIQLQSQGMSKTEAQHTIAKKTRISMDVIRYLPDAVKYFNADKLTASESLELGLTVMCALSAPKVKAATRRLFIKQAKAGLSPTLSAVRWQIWNDNKDKGAKKPTPSPEVAFIVKTEHLKCEVYTTKKMTAKAMKKELLAYLTDGEAEVVVKSRRRYRRAA